MILLISTIVGAIHGWREFRDGKGIVMGAILGPCLTFLGMLFIGLVGVGVGYLFNWRFQG